MCAESPGCQLRTSDGYTDGSTHSHFNRNPHVNHPSPSVGHANDDLDGKSAHTHTNIDAFFNIHTHRLAKPYSYCDTNANADTDIDQNGDSHGNLATNPDPNRTPCRVYAVDQ